MESESFIASCSESKGYYLAGCVASERLNSKIGSRGCSREQTGRVPMSQVCSENFILSHRISQSECRRSLPAILSSLYFLRRRHPAHMGLDSRSLNTGCSLWLQSPCRY